METDRGTRVMTAREVRRLINLEQYIGANSRIDEGGALRIYDVVVFEAGVYKDEVGNPLQITNQHIVNTNWYDIMGGRPVVQGHMPVDGENYSYLQRGAITNVKLREYTVVADLLIHDLELQKAIIAKALTSVSLSFIWDGMKVVYINHLGVVEQGQVAKAVINLENKEVVNMDIDKKEVEHKIDNSMKLENERLKKELGDMKEATSKFNLKKQTNEAVELALKKQQAELEKLHTLKLEATAFNLSAEGTTEEITAVIESHKQKKIKEVLGDVKGDVDTLFNLAVKQSKENKEATVKNKETVLKSNVNLSQGAGKPRTLADILQEKANAKRLEIDKGLVNVR